VLVIPLAYLVIEANNARILNDVAKAMRELMGAPRYRGGELLFITGLASLAAAT